MNTNTIHEHGHRPDFHLIPLLIEIHFVSGVAENELIIIILNNNIIILNNSKY